MLKLHSILEPICCFGTNSYIRQFAIVAIILLLARGKVVAATYQVNLGLVTDFEDLRPLIDRCSDLGSLETLRRQLEAASDLERLRPLLEKRGLVEFRMCPDSISAPGVKKL